MNIAHEDSALFFRLMWEVQFYVNQKLDILPDVKSVEKYARLPSEEKIKARDALYQHPELLEAFVSENPAKLSSDELEIVKSWKRPVVGDFYVMRFLKKYVVFMSSAEPVQFYGVLGLYEPLEAVLGWQSPPIMVKAVLLPFKGRIIYDGLLMSYSIYFGPGFRGSFNESYQRAKQRGGIIENLDPGGVVVQPKPKKPARDWRPEVDSIVEMAEKLGRAENKVQSQAFSLLKASAKLAQATARAPADYDDVYEQGRRVSRALKQLQTALERELWND